MYEFPVLNFSHFSLEDMRKIGVDEKLFSPYNVKALDSKGALSGYMIITYTPINAIKHYDLPLSIKNSIGIINSNKWYNLRTIKMKKEHRFDGNIENMFDYLISILPKDCYLWSNSYWDRNTNYLLQLGFTELPSELNQNKNIRVFNVYHLNLE